MTHYFAPTVIVPPLPIQDISRFEMFILKKFFQFEIQGDELIYFFSHEGPFNTDNILVGTLREYLDDYKPNGKGISHDIWEFIGSGSVDENFPFGVEFNEEMLVEILENILERSSSVKRIDVVQSYMCDKMVMEGFGGRRISITSKYVDIIDTSDLDDDAIVEENESLDNKLLDSIKTLVKLALDTQKCMNGFAEAVRNVTGTPYPCPEMDLINQRFEEAGLDKALEESPKRDLSGLKSLDDFLEEEGILEEVTRGAQNRVDAIVSEHPRLGEKVVLADGTEAEVSKVRVLKIPNPN